MTRLASDSGSGLAAGPGRSIRSVAQSSSTYGSLTVQRPLPVFENVHAGLAQVGVEHVHGAFDLHHVRVALDDQLHVQRRAGQHRRSPGASGNRAIKQALAMMDFALCPTDGQQVVALDVAAVPVVVAADEERGAGPPWAPVSRSGLPGPGRRASVGEVRVVGVQQEFVDLAGGGALHLDRPAWPAGRNRSGAGPILVMPPTKATLGITATSLRWRAPEQIGTHADQPAAWRVQMNDHAGLHQFRPGILETGSAEPKPSMSQRHADAPVRRRDQRASRSGWPTSSSNRMKVVAAARFAARKLRWPPVPGVEVLLPVFRVGELVSGRPCRPMLEAQPRTMPAGAERAPGLAGQGLARS